MKEILLHKLFYNKFSHRLVINCYTKAELARNNYDFFVAYQSSRWYDIKEAAAANITGKMRTRINGWHKNAQMSVFFSDAEAVDKLVKLFGDRVVSVERPKDDDHLKAVSRDKFIVRKSLYYSRYRHRFQLNVISYESGWARTNSMFAKWLEIEAWLLGYCKNMGRESGVDFYINKGGWHPTVFFANDADASMFKLTWGDNVKNSHRVKLESEV